MVETIESISKLAKNQNISLVTEGIYLFEYDIPSGYRDSAEKIVSIKYTKEQAEYFQSLRSHVVYELKANIKKVAINLYSSWIVDKTVLDSVEQLAQETRDSLIAHGFSEKAKKIKVFPVFTTQEGFETYQQRKEEFYLEYLAEIQKSVEKALTEKKTNDKKDCYQIIRKSEKALESIIENKESLKDKSAKSRYKEINELIISVDESLSELKILEEKSKEKQKLEKELAKAKKA